MYHQDVGLKGEKYNGKIQLGTPIGRHQCRVRNTIEQLEALEYRQLRVNSVTWYFSTVANMLE